MSNEIIGREIELSVGVEASRGVAESSATKNVRKVTCSIIPQVERATDDSTLNRLEDSVNIRKVKEWSEGDLESILHIDAIGFLLLNLYGSVESSADGSAYVHEFTLLQNILHPTLTLFIKDGNVRQEKIAGAVVSSLEITSAVGELVRFTSSFIGGAGVDDASTIPEPDTEYDFVSRDIVAKIADDESGLTSADALKLKNCSIKINANAEADFVFGSYTPDNIYNKTFSIEGDFELNYTDDTFLTLSRGDDNKYMSFVITGQADLGGGKHPTFSLLLNKVRIVGWDRGSEADNLVTQKVSFKALLNVDDMQQSKITLTNLTASYAVGS